jgi:hypothetical protein
VALFLSFVFNRVNSIGAKDGIRCPIKKAAGKRQTVYKSIKE